MIKTIFEKWDEVKKECLDPNKIFVLPFYLGSSKASIYLSIWHNKLSLYLEFIKEVLVEFEIPEIKGMNIEVKEAVFIDPNKKYIYIENDSDNEDVFIAFSSSLADQLQSSKSYYEVYETFKNVVKEYKEYFSNPNRCLDKFQEQGLCAELIELKQIIQLKGEKYLLSWLGPSKNKRDFVFKNNVSMEIKSTSSQINSSITISNENQLDSSFPDKLNKLFLSVYILEDDKSGFNVCSLGKLVLDSIESAGLRDVFKANLLKNKVDLNIYKPGFNFTIQSHNYYLVDEKFPKIIKKDISSMVFDVKYRLKLDELNSFTAKMEDVYDSF